MYHESEPVEEARFDGPDDAEDACTAMQIRVEDPFEDRLREDVAATIREHHDRDVVVGAYDGEGGPDVAQGACRVR